MMFGDNWTRCSVEIYLGLGLSGRVRSTEHGLGVRWKSCEVLAICKVYELCNMVSVCEIVPCKNIVSKINEVNFSCRSIFSLKLHEACMIWLLRAV